MSERKKTMSTNSYFRIQPGDGNIFSADFFRQGFIGIDFLEDEDLSIPVKDSKKNGESLLRNYCKDMYTRKKGVYKKETSRSINMASGKIVNFCLNIKIGDIVLCPDDCGNYALGKITGGYKYVLPKPAKKMLPPHRLDVEWQLNKGISARNMSLELTKIVWSRGTIISISDEKCCDEIERFYKGKNPNTQIYSGYIADSEKMLEDKLSELWADKYSKKHRLMNDYKLLEASHKLFSEIKIKKNKNYSFARQVHTNIGETDLLAINKSGSQLLVVEIKKKRGSDEAVGQLLRYMGYLGKELKRIGSDMRVKGCIIAHGEDHNIICALEALEILKNFQNESKRVDDIDFYRYEATKQDLSDLNLVKIDISKSARV